jgi:SnoaL-like domain
MQEASVAETALDELLAKQEIYEVVLRYCRGVDRLELDLVRSAYHPDGVDHHTGFDGTIDEYVEWVSAALARFRGTMHLIANHSVDLYGDVAVVETYGTAVHWGDPPDEPRRNFTSGFRYVDRMQRRDGCWAIAERWAVREWTRSDVGLAMAKEGTGPSGSRDRSDPLYRALSATIPGTGS